MAMVKKSITVTQQQDNWIKRQIDSGFYGNESEVLRGLIREKQSSEHESEAQIQYIRNKLIEAESKGFTQQTSDEILREIKGELKNG